jgi:tetratricopeptide (TPR) repeat protein
MSRRRLSPWLTRAALLAATLALTGWNLSRSTRLEAASRAYEKGRYLQALQAALDHLGRRPWSREATRIAALSFSQLDYATKAEPYYDRLGALSLEEARTRAFALLRSNRRLDAEAAYKEILARWPDDPDALRQLAALYLTMTRLDAGAELAERLATRPGHEIVGLTMLGSLRHRQREHRLALDAFEEILRLDPDLAKMPLPPSQFWGYYLRELIAVGRNAEAARRAEALLAGTPDDATVLDLLGTARMALGELDQAEAAWREALHADAGRADSWNNLGRLLLTQGKTEEAVPLLEKAVQLDPNGYYPTYNLMLANRRLGRQDEVSRLQKRLDEIKARFGTPTQTMGSS